MACGMKGLIWCVRSGGILVSFLEEFISFLTLVKGPLVRGNWCILINVIKGEKTSCERQFVWLDQWGQVRDNCSKISEILFDQWGQMWETIVVRSVRSCRSVRSSGGLVLQWGAKPLRQIWVQWEHPNEGDLFCGCRLRPNHVRSCVCDYDCCWHWSAYCVVGSLPGWLRFPETDAGKSWGVVALLSTTGCLQGFSHLV